MKLQFHTGSTNFESLVMPGTVFVKADGTHYQIFPGTDGDYRLINLTEGHYVRDLCVKRPTAVLREVYEADYVEITHVFPGNRILLTEDK